MEGICRVVLKGTFSTFVWRNGGKPQRILISTAGLRAEIRKEYEPPNRDIPPKSSKFQTAVSMEFWTTGR
jgi:hypothetical protein